MADGAAQAEQSAPRSLRWLCAHLLGVQIGTARFQKVLGTFMDHATARARGW